MRTKLIELRKVNKIFNNEVIINDLDMEIYQDEIVVILGKSGIGKSTLFRMISKLDTDYMGEIIYSKLIFEKNSIPLPVVFQSFDQLLPWYDIKKNILLPFNSDSKMKNKFELIVKKLELTDHLKKYPKEISGGMKQRAAIARTLLTDSKIIFLDEPFGSLDIIMRRNLQDLILKIKKEFNKTMFFITHDIEEAVYLADRIIIMQSSEKRIEIDLRDKNFKRYTAEFDEKVNEIIELVNNS
jgi:ABC-type nitrate/sulfonate/bicarbonate transport system ATPase subunit